jgi:ankyrin repeat protein
MNDNLSTMNRLVFPGEFIHFGNPISLEDFAKAIEHGDSTTVDTLLTSGLIDVNARLPRDCNPPSLVFAAHKLSASIGVDIVEKLLNAGARIDDVDDFGRTACYVATMCRNVDVLAVLLAHRPNLELRDTRVRITPLELSFNIGNGNAKGDCISLMLINAGASIAGERLCRLALQGTAAIQALLNRGVVVNQLRDSVDLDYTPLHVIAKYPHMWSADSDAAVRMLVNVCGVDLQAQTVAGSSPTHIAATTGNEMALRCFIAAGADVDYVDRGQQTPLHVTSAYNCAILLLAAGANVNARDRKGRTTFQLAVRCQSTALLSALIAAGADPSDVQSVGDISIEQVESARRDIAKSRLDFVRHRAWQVCIGLQWRQLDALQMCIILRHACGPVAQLIAFHQWWKIATTVKHFKSKSTSTGSTGTL